MEYAYFSLTNPGLKDKGLKLVVAFDHRGFWLEVWLSGGNLATQCRWADYWEACPSPMELSQAPITLILWCSCQWKPICLMGQNWLPQSKQR